MPADHYATLGVSPTSDDVAVRAAFRALMRQWHPDTNSAPDAHRRAAEINAAFHVLGNARRRALYDAQRSPPGQGAAAPPPPPPPFTPGRAGGPVPRKTVKRASPDAWIKRGLLVVGAGLVLTLVMEFAEQPRASQAAMLAGGPGPSEGEAGSDEMPQWTAAERSRESAEVTRALASVVSMDVELPAAPASPRVGEIGTAAATVETILHRSGYAGARLWSQTCHYAVRAEPSWAAADRCAAFDFAAHAIDRGTIEAVGGAANSYFAYQAGNQAAHYRQLSDVPAALVDRLGQIQRAVEPLADAVVRVGIAQRTRQRAATPAPLAAVPAPAALATAAAIPAPAPAEPQDTPMANAAAH